MAISLLKHTVVCRATIDGSSLDVTVVDVIAPTTTTATAIATDIQRAHCYCCGYEKLLVLMIVVPPPPPAAPADAAAGITITFPAVATIAFGMIRVTTRFGFAPGHDSQRQDADCLLQADAKIVRQLLLHRPSGRMLQVYDTHRAQLRRFGSPIPKPLALVLLSTVGLLPRKACRL